MSTLAEPIQQLLQIGRQRCHKLAFFAARRQTQAEPVRMQKLPVQRQARCVESVKCIAHDGVLQPGEVHANLVRAARM
jgi:hypothetical protein